MQMWRAWEVPPIIENERFKKEHLKRPDLEGGDPKEKPHSETVMTSLTHTNLWQSHPNN